MSSGEVEVNEMNELMTDPRFQNLLGKAESHQWKFRPKESELLDSTGELLPMLQRRTKSWPSWDNEIERIDHDGSVPRNGTRFALKPKGGPKTTLCVQTAEDPSLFVDVSLLPLGRMRTRHEFIRIDETHTEVRLIIETFGPLGFLWDRVIARKQARNAEHQAHALATFARSQTQ